MNPNAKEWVAALRSGEFEQVTGWLSKDGRYCCLGVGCEVFRRQTGRGRWGIGSEERIPFRVDIEEEVGALPAAVRDWLGLSGREGQISAPWIASLAALNDDGATFDQIADLIESEPAGLFVQEGNR